METKGNVKQVFVQKGVNSLRMDERDIAANQPVSPGHQILHYKRLVVPANMRSIYWKCYGFPANDDNEILTKSKIICLLCKSTMTYNRNTTNLRMHLHNKHKSELATLEIMQPAPSNKKGDLDRRSIKKTKKEVDQRNRNSSSSLNSSANPVFQVFPVTHNSDEVNENSFMDVDDMNPLAVIVKEAVTPTSGPQNFTLVDGKAIADAIADFIILDLQSPDIVEGKGFQRLIGTLKSPCEIPSKALLMDELIPKIYDVVKEQLFAQVSTLTVPISLSVEDWVSSSGDVYSTVSIHFVTPTENELQNRVLSTIYCSDFDALHWGAQFDAILDEYQIKLSQVRAVVLASDREDVVDSLVARGCAVVPCFSFALQVCANQVLDRPEVKEVVKKCRAIVAHVSRSPAAMAELKLQDNVNQLEDSQLSLDSSSGWMTTLLMIEQVQARRTTLSTIIDSLGSSICPTSSVELSDHEWSIIDDAISVLYPFRLTVATLIEEKNPLISIMKPILSQLLTVHLNKSPTDSELRSSLKTLLVETLTNRYKDEKINEMFEISSALDPRFKSLPFLADEEKKTAVKNKIQKLLRAQSNHSELSESKSSLSKKRLSGMEYLLGELVTVKSEMPSNQRSELEMVQYEWEKQADLEKCPIEWWRDMNGKCFHVAALAQAYLCTPVCARGHLQHTLSPTLLLQNLPAQFALKLKFLNSNYVASND